MNVKRCRLKDIEISEISLVQNPANRIKFLFFKSEGDETMDDLEELLDMCEHIEKKLDLSEEDQNVIGEALRVLNGLDEKDINGLAKAIKVLSKLVATGYAYGYPEVKKSLDNLWPTAEGLLSITKAGAGIDVAAKNDGSKKWPSVSSDE